MRILAIRGKNLASLQGEFELRLDQPPISSANLFSISGPTGSGKSTLLDALCLALYGKTPRLSDDGGHPIGAYGEDEKLRLKSNDARALLSRGTADGFAQVDFQGADGKRYRATWKVHRARNLGRFQNQTMALVDLDSGDTVSTQITEVRQAIEARVGFTFEEFKRTVLLPQFEFTNFLRAKPDDRAQILEHVMGGEVFTKLSMAAHERAASERDKLARLRDKLGMLMTLSEDDRVQLDTLAQDTAQAVEKAKATMEGAGRDLAWHEQRAVLLDAVELATGALAEAEQSLALAAPLEEEVQAVWAAQPLRAVRDAATKAAGVQSKAKAELDEIGGKLQQAMGDLEIAEQALAKAESGLKMARENEATLRPEIERAKHLDAQIAPARRTAEGARAECERLRDLVDHGRRELEDLVGRTAKCEDERCQAEQWLATHAAESQLSGQWPRWQAELRKHAALGKELGTSATKLVTAQEAAAVAVRERGKAADLESEAEKVFEAAQTEWEKAAAALEGQDLATLKARTSGLREDLDQLESLAVIVERAQSAQGAITAARLQATEFRAAQQRSRLDAERLAGDLGRSQLRTDEARFALETTRSALSFDEQRTLLKDGQACPLCGSPDHPYVHGSLPSATIGALESRVRELERLERDLQATGSAAEAAQAVAGTNAASAENAANDSIAESERAQHDYHAAVKSLTPDLPALAVEASTAIKTKVEQAQAKLDQAESDEQHVLDLASKQDRARDALDEARSKREAAVEAHAGLLKQEQDLAGAVDRLVDEQIRLATERDSIETLLTPVMTWHPDWVGAARQESQVFLEYCDARVQELEACQRRFAAAVEMLAALCANRETGEALLGERQTHFEKSATHLKDQEDARTALQGQRAALLHGRGVLDVEFELSKLIEDATASHESARNVHAGAGTALALAQAAHEEASRRQHEIDQEAAHAELALDVGLARLGIGRQKLEERLHHDETWIAQRRKDLDALRESVTRDRATRDERQRSLDDHTANGRPEGDRDVAQERVASARAQMKELGQTLIGLTAKQKQDDDQRLGRSSVLAEVHAQEESSRVWEQLDDVIGSADGKKFRIFAQSLAVSVRPSASVGQAEFG